MAKQQHVIDQWCKAVGVPDHEEPTDDVTVMSAGAEGPGDDDADTGVFDDDDADVVQVCALVCQQFIDAVLVIYVRVHCTTQQQHGAAESIGWRLYHSTIQ